MLVDGFTSLKAYLYDRVVSPLYGSVAVAWLAWNYKFVFLMFSDLKYQDKLRMISILYDSAFEVWGTALIFPLITAFVYLFLLPYPAQFVYGYNLEKQNRLIALKQKIEGSKLLTLERSIEIRNELDKIKIEHETKYEQMEVNIARYKNLYESNLNELNTLRVEYNEHLAQMANVVPPESIDSSLPLNNIESTDADSKETKQTVAKNLEEQRGKNETNEHSTVPAVQARELWDEVELREQEEQWALEAAQAELESREQEEQWALEAAQAELESREQEEQWALEAAQAELESREQWTPIEPSSRRTTELVSSYEYAETIIIKSLDALNNEPTERDVLIEVLADEMSISTHLAKRLFEMLIYKDVIVNSYDYQSDYYELSVYSQDQLLNNQRYEIDA